MNFKKLLPLALCTVLVLGSCDDDDDDRVTVPSVVNNNFSQRFPNATTVNWEKEEQHSATFLKAEFKENGKEVEAWFTFDGTWLKTETDFTGTLPAKVSEYLQSHYVGYRTEDIEWIETPRGNFFMIELEKGDYEVELYINEEGQVIFIDDESQPVPTTVLENFAKRYPGATVEEWEKERHYLKAEFHNGLQEAEAWFTYDGTWIRTETHFAGALPQPVANYISTHYAGYRIDTDEVKWIETHDQNFFEIELEKEENEILLNIQEDGTFISSSTQED